MLEARILSDHRSIAMVGASANPERPSYQVYPVNPNTGEVLGRLSYPSLSSIPEPVEVVNEKAAAKARNANLLTAANKCIREEHQDLRGKLN
jgi:predicted CoA-binding protein